MHYKLNCKITEKDYYEFNKYHSITSPDIKKLRFIEKLFVPVAFLFMIAYYFLRGDDWYLLLFGFVVFSVISVIYILSLKPISLLILKLHIKFMKKAGKLPFSENSTLEFYDEYFTESTENTKTQIQYSGIFKVRINDNKAIYIYQNTILAYIIPFDVFFTVDDRNKFIEFISKKSKKNI